jgi:hypothetical protein
LVSATIQTAASAGNNVRARIISEKNCLVGTDGAKGVAPGAMV